MQDKNCKKKAPGEPPQEPTLLTLTGQPDTITRAKVSYYFGNSKCAHLSRMNSSTSALRFTPARRRSRDSSWAWMVTERTRATFFCPGRATGLPAPGLVPPRLISRHPSWPSGERPVWSSTAPPGPQLLSPGLRPGPPYTSPGPRRLHPSFWKSFHRLFS